MSNNNSYFFEVIEKEKRNQIQKDLENAWHLNQLPEKESTPINPLDTLLHFFKRLSIVIRLPRFSSLW